MVLPTGLRCGGRARRILTRRTCLSIGLIFFASILLGICPAARADLASDEKGTLLSISGIVVSYAPTAAVRTDLLPPIADVAEAPIELGNGERNGLPVFVSPASRNELGENGTTQVKLSDFPTLPDHLFAPSALRSVSEQITSFMNSRGIAGVYVEPDATDIVRAESVSAARAPVVVRFIVHVAVVRRVQTMEVGEYYPGTDSNGNGKTNNQFDRAIVRHSPVQPTTDDIMHTDEVDDYVFYLNRQPGQQVNASIDAAEGPDSVSLDYMIARDKPWEVYAQVSNTGTKQTGEWMERLGAVDYQLTGNDDTLAVDYSTAGFDKENSVNVSYEKPMFGLPRTRGKVYLGYDEFNASDVGDSLVNFTGQTLTVGSEVDQNIFQYHQLFVDVIAGVRYENIHVDNTTDDTDGRGNFLMPYIGVHMDRSVRVDSISADLTLLGSLSDSSQATRDALGRLDAAQDAAILQADYGYSLYLEPLFDPHSYETGHGTLANEAVFSVKGQYSFNQRLIAEQEYVAGGLYTVRGYPQSVAAGDNVFIGSAEYRLHIPRLFGVEPEEGKLFGQPFRWAPQQTYGAPDWDLILSLFIDGGQVYNAQRESYETNATLVGTGIGIDLKYRDNVDLSVDFGKALTPIIDTQTGQTLTGSGSNEVNLVLTIKL